ncbi:preprotein translocase subunit SecA, partial [Candidatus Poribacteria bacterium]|nr:preprotein translocase subunit SecA [Candidatus Poribacteria bacterium]
EEESMSTARITYQNYFRLYNKLAGMTGTAETEAAEFAEVYNLDVIVIPTNKPVIREDHADVIYKTEREKFNAIIEEINDMNEIGRPVLVGTRSIDTSERLSSLLKKNGITHHVLNAKYHEKEAEIISRAGEYEAVTIATNMAGRGVDIFLGEKRSVSLGSDAINELDSGHIPRELKQKFDGERIPLADDAEISVESPGDRWKVISREQTYPIRRLGDALEVQVEILDKRVLEQGGLHIIGTERHESRRIDNQLRGRSGRQGDVGSSRFFLSLEDELMQKFGTEKLSNAMDWLGMKEGVPIEHNWITKAIENAQKRVEGHNFEYRKHLLKYDDVRNTQRTVIYEQRNNVLEGGDLKSEILDMLTNMVSDYIDMYLVDNDEKDFDALTDWVKQTFLVDMTKWSPKPEKMSPDEIHDKLLETLTNIYEEREKQMSSKTMRELERFIMLNRIDEHWVDHLYNMDYMEMGIGLRAYGQKDPLVEFKREAHDMFNMMIERIKEEVVEYMFKIQIVEESELEQQSSRPKADEVPRQRLAISRKQPSTRNMTVQNVEKVGRNDPCPCGSGKKYKKCCGR